MIWKATIVEQIYTQSYYRSWKQILPDTENFITKIHVRICDFKQDDTDFYDIAYCCTFLQMLALLIMHSFCCFVFSLMTGWFKKEINKTKIGDLEDLWKIWLDKGRLCLKMNILMKCVKFVTKVYVILQYRPKNIKGYM